MMGELVTLARTQHDDNKLIHDDKLDAITEAVRLRGEEVIAWVGDGQGNEGKGAKRLTRLRPLTKWLKSIDRRLESIDRKTDEILSRLKKIEKQGVRTEQGVREGTSTTGKRVAAAHTKTRKHLGLLIGGVAVVVLAAVLVTFAASSKRSDARAAEAERLAKVRQTEADARADARIADLKDSLRSELLAVLDERRTLPTTIVGPDGEQITTNPSFTDADRVIAAKASDSDDPLTRAMAAIIEGDTAGARAELEMMPDPAQTAYDYYTALGDSYYFEQRFDEAVPQYELAKNMLGPKPTAQAIINLANALTRSSSGDLVAGEHRVIELYTQVIEVLEVTADSIAKALVGRGYTHGRHGRVEEAVTDFSHAIDLPGASVGQVAIALYNRGVLYGQEDHLADAIADYTRVIELEGAPIEQIAWAFVGRAVTHGQQDHLAGAIVDYTRVIDLPVAPVRYVAFALVNRGLIYDEQGRHAEAIADWTRVIEMKNASADLVANALYNRGLLHKKNASTKAPACADFAQAAQLYASIGKIDMQEKAELQRQDIGCDD